MYNTFRKTTALLALSSAIILSQDAVAYDAVAAKKTNMQDNIDVPEKTQDAKILSAEEFEILKKQAEEGDVEAQFNLGVMYDQGQGVEKSYEIAKSWFDKAAKQGHTKAQYNLGTMYDQGRGVEQSFETAFSWLEKAAKQNHQGAIKILEILKK